MSSISFAISKSFKTLSRPERPFLKVASSPSSAAIFCAKGPSQCWRPPPHQKLQCSIKLAHVKILWRHWDTHVVRVPYNRLHGGLPKGRKSIIGALPNMLLETHTALSVYKRDTDFKGLESYYKGERSLGYTADKLKMPLKTLMEFMIKRGPAPILGEDRARGLKKPPRFVLQHDLPVKPSVNLPPPRTTLLSLLQTREVRQGDIQDQPRMKQSYTVYG